MGRIEDEAMAPNGIEVVVVDGSAWVRLHGEIDVALRDQASESMAAALSAPGPVVVDATDVTFIDSSGAAFVLQLCLAARESGQHVTLRDPQRVVLDILQMLGVAEEVLLDEHPAGRGSAAR